MAKQMMPELDPAAIEAEIDRVVQLTNLPRPEVAAAMARLCGKTSVTSSFQSHPPKKHVSA